MLKLTMAHHKVSDGARTESPESLRPTMGDRQESVHPGLRPSLRDIPVTPGFHLGEYDSRPGTEDSSYFGHDLKEADEDMAQSPSHAASGATSDADVLRRMSLNDSGRQRRDSLLEVDPRAAHPSLNLSGGVISATFAIPNQLTYRKGKDWVSEALLRQWLRADSMVGS